MHQHSPNAGSYREVWNLAYPAILTMISQTIMWTVDSAMVGRVGKVELAAVGLGGVMVWTIYSFFLGLSTSVNTFVSQNYGAKRLQACAEYLAQGLIMALSAGALIYIIREFNPQIVSLLRPEKDVAERCLLYADIRMISAPFTMMHFAYSNFFRGIGNTRTPMKVVAFANLINITGDYFLIFGKGPFPAMGVLGAAWATSLANFLAAICFTAISLSGRYRKQFPSYRYWRPRLKSIANLLGIGVPIAFHFFLDMGSFLIFSAYIGRMGTEPLAANQIIIQILALSFMPCQGFGIAATTLMGQYIGSGTPRLAKRSAYTALKLGVLYSCFLALLYVLLPGPMVRLFNSDPTVLSLGRRIILWAAVFQLFDTVEIIASGALAGAGDTKVPMILAIIGAYFLFLPLSFLFGSILNGGVVWAWAGATTYVVFLGTTMFFRLQKGNWKRIALLGRAPFE